MSCILICSLKPDWFLKKFTCQKQKPGVYRVAGVSFLPIWLVIIEQLGKNEVERLQLFSSPQKAGRLFAIQERRRERHKALKTAINLKKMGLSIKQISEGVELPEEKLERFFRKIGLLYSLPAP